MNDDLMTWLRAQLDEDEQETPSCDHMDYQDRWTISRMLVEVEAKRRIIDWCESMHPYDGLGGLLAGEARRVLCLLALPYADRPGYREEWRPAPS